LHVAAGQVESAAVDADLAAVVQFHLQCGRAVAGLDEETLVVEDRAVRVNSAKSAVDLVIESCVGEVGEGTGRFTKEPHRAASPDRVAGVDEREVTNRICAVQR